jgi:pyruvate formate lyase activating enzyme
MYTESKCIGTVKCVEICPESALQLTRQGIVTDVEKCTLCGKCATVCPTKAIEMSGKVYSNDELMKIIERETIFFDHSEGGVTFSGGEPLMHYKSLIEILDKCAEKDIHRVVDTTLFAKSEVVLEVARRTNLFLVDFKAFESEVHRKYTGVNNELILKNIQLLAENNADFIIRVPFIKGVNADEETVERMADFLSSIPWKRKEVNLLPYHDVGKHKHTKLGSEYLVENMEVPSEDELTRAQEIFADYGISASVGG